MKLVEAKNLDIYKRLLRIIAEYVKNNPATGMDRLFDMACAGGIKIMPTDKLALEILDCVLNENSVSNSIQQLLNMRFSNCKIRPLTKEGRKHSVASWTRNDFTSDRIKDLINWEAKGSAGFWSDINGEKVTLVDMSKEEK